VYDLPELEGTDRFDALTTLNELRGIALGDPILHLPPGAELAAITEAPSPCTTCQSSKAPTVSRP